MRELKRWPTWQWLTANSSFQDMASSFGPPKTAVLQGRKQEFRIAVEIPHYGRGRLRRWIEFAKAQQIPLRVEINRDLGTPEEWWIYAGVIPSKWFRGIHRNPTARDTTWDKPVPRIEIPMDTRGYAPQTTYMGGKPGRNVFGGFTL